MKRFLLLSALVLVFHPPLWIHAGDQEKQFDHERTSSGLRGATMMDGGHHGWIGGWDNSDNGDNNGGDDSVMSGGGGHMEVMSVIQALLSGADAGLIERTVHPLYLPDATDESEPVGVETFTTSSDASVVFNLQRHVSQMQELHRQAQDGGGGDIRHWDPLFEALHIEAGNVEIAMAPLENGVHAWHAGATRCAAALIDAHADAVTKFASDGHAEAMQSHPVPDVCSSDTGHDPTGFINLWQLDSGAAIPANDISEAPNDEVGDGEWNDDEDVWNNPQGMPCGNGTSDPYYNYSYGMHCYNETLNESWNCTSGMHCGNGYDDYNCSQGLNCANGTFHGGWNCTDQSRCNSSTTSDDNSNFLPEGQGSTGVTVSRSSLQIFLALCSAFLGLLNGI
jgi:hypothetical protein